MNREKIIEELDHNIKHLGWGAHRITEYILDNFIPKEKYKKYIAWCPDCFDGLECKQIMENNIIKRFEYHCFGCGKTFKLSWVYCNSV